MPDQVRVLATCDPQFGTRLVKQVKGSSRPLRQEFAQLKSRSVLWTTYFAFVTVGGANLEVVKRYVENERNARSTPIPPQG